MNRKLVQQFKICTNRLDAIKNKFNQHFQHQKKVAPFHVYSYGCKICNFRRHNNMVYRKKKGYASPYQLSTFVILLLLVVGRVYNITIEIRSFIRHVVDKQFVMAIAVKQRGITFYVYLLTPVGTFCAYASQHTHWNWKGTTIYNYRSENAMCFFKIY